MTIDRTPALTDSPQAPASLAGSRTRTARFANAPLGTGAVDFIGLVERGRPTEHNPKTRQCSCSCAQLRRHSAGPNPLTLLGRPNTSLDGSTKGERQRCNVLSHLRLALSELLEFAVSCNCQAQLLKTVPPEIVKFIHVSKIARRSP